MTDTELSDDGWYACTATNSKGSKESKVYLQILKDPLKVHTYIQLKLENVPENLSKCPSINLVTHFLRFLTTPSLLSPILLNRLME